MDGADFMECESPLELTGLTDGSHTLEVRARRGSRVDDTPESASFEVDTIAPTLSVNGPSGPVGAGPLDFQFGCDEAICAYECSVDGAEFTPCAGNFQTASLARGAHSIEIRALDPAGNAQSTRVDVVAAFGWSDIAVSQQTTCGISDLGDLYCWGDDAQGALGDGAPDASPFFAPTSIATGTRWSRVFAASDAHVFCALDESATLHCWGDLNDTIGWDETVEPTSLPLPSAVMGVSEVAFGDSGACFLDEGGALYCVGRFARTAAGVDPTEWVAMDDGEYSRLTVSQANACALRVDGALMCWGEPDYVGQADATEHVVTPTQVGSDVDWTAIAADEFRTCGLRAGELYCWGWGYWDAADAWELRKAPTRVGDGGDWVELWGANARICVRDAAHQLACEGENGGAFGDGTTAAAFPLRPIEGLESMRQMSFGSTVTCGIDAANRLSCWGGDILGNGERYFREEPVHIDGGWAQLAVSRAGRHACGIRTNGTLYCWGNSERGAVGVGMGEDVVTPTQVGDRTDWTSVSAGGDRTCGIAGGALYCWGNNVNGWLGFGTDPERSNILTPELVDDTRTYTAVATTHHDTCAIGDGELHCVGLNSRGQLGLGHRNRTTTWTRVGTENDWSVISMMDLRTCGVREDGVDTDSLWCWGDNGVIPQDTPKYEGAAGAWDAVVAGNGVRDCFLRGGGMWCLSRPGVGDPAPELDSVAGFGDWIAMDLRMQAGGCGVRASGELRCWGMHNFDRRFLGSSAGTSTTVAIESPVVRTTSFSAASVSLGQFAYCALDPAGERYCWGAGTALGIASLEWRLPQLVLTPADPQ